MEDAKQTGRSAYERRAWADAFAALSRASAQGPLEVEDVERLAWSAVLAGREQESLEALERLHQLRLDAGEALRAARIAFWLAMRLSAFGEMARASGWLARAQRLVEREGKGVDCGTCVQVSVNRALNDGARPEWISAALEGRPGALPAELRDIYEFTGHILRHDYQEDALRETIRNRYGDKGLVDLAFAIASAQVFPLTKQVLGFAKSCSKVKVTVQAQPAAGR